MFKFLLIFTLLVTHPIDAYAYINPSTVGLVIAALAGSIAVIGYYARRIFILLKSFFTKNNSKKE